PLPRFSTGYWPLRDRLAVLVETHSWKNYATRVKTTRDVMLALLTSAAKDGRAWLEAARAADATSLAGASVPLTYQNGGAPKKLSFRGYQYTREPSTISGRPWVRYDDTKPQLWDVPLWDELAPATSAIAPRGGYVVSAGYAELVGQKLALHGFKTQRLT